MAPDEEERSDAGEQREHERGESGAGDQAVEERVGVGSKNRQAGERERPRDQASGERAFSESRLELGLLQSGRVSAEKDASQVGGGGDGEKSDQDRGWVEPAGELAARGVADRDSS